MKRRMLFSAAVALCCLGGMAGACAFPPSVFVFGFTGLAGQPAPMLLLGNAGLITTSGYPNSAATGWWDAFGHHTMGNYITGRVADRTFRGYYVFDLSGVQGPISVAELVIYNPGPADNPGHENGFQGAWNATISVFDVSTPIAELEGFGFSPFIYSDLGSGTLYGQQFVTAGYNGRFVPFALNDDALAALNANLGSQIAFGTTMTAFFPTPEPASLALFGASFAGAFALRRRSRGSAASQLAIRLLLAIAP